MEFPSAAAERKRTIDRNHHHTEPAASDHRGAVGPAEMAVDDRHHRRLREVAGLVIDVAEEFSRVVDDEDAGAETLLGDIFLFTSEKVRPPAGSDGSASVC